MIKRRKDKYNPYTLMFEEGIYKVEFKDSKGNNQVIEINQNIYKAFNEFELKDLSHMNEYDNHIEHSEIYEYSLYKRAVYKEISVEERIEKNINFERLKKVIDSLPEVQKRRIRMYYFEDKNLEEIARLEHVSHQAISKSIKNSLNKIKEKYKI